MVGIAASSSESRPVASLRVFILWSLLWHGLQAFLFLVVFRVDNPRLIQEGAGSHLVAQVLLPEASMPSIIQSESLSDSDLMSRESALEPDEAVPWEESFRWSSLPSLVERQKPKSDEAALKRPKLSSPEIQNHTRPLVSDSEVSTRVDVRKKVESPFLMSGDVRLRRIVQSSTLPEYPEWALVAAVELSCRVALSVDESGRPYQVYIEESSGDSQTDLAVMEYVEALRFEPSLSESRGSIEWVFALER